MGNQETHMISKSQDLTFDLGQCAMLLVPHTPLGNPVGLSNHLA